MASIGFGERMAFLMKRFGIFVYILISITATWLCPRFGWYFGGEMHRYWYQEEETQLSRTVALYKNDKGDVVTIIYGGRFTKEIELEYNGGNKIYLRYTMSTRMVEGPREVTEEWIWVLGSLLHADSSAGYFDKYLLPVLAIVLLHAILGRIFTRVERIHSNPHSPKIKAAIMISATVCISMRVF